MIVGFDGQDPVLTDRLMGQGKLPHLARLAKKGLSRPGERVALGASYCMSPDCTCREIDVRAWRVEELPKGVSEAAPRAVLAGRLDLDMDHQRYWAVDSWCLAPRCTGYNRLQVGAAGNACI